MTALAVILTFLTGSVHAADVPFVGTWKLVVSEGTQTINLCLIKIEDKDGKPTASVAHAGLAQFADATLEKVKIDAKEVEFTIVNGRAALAVKAYPRKGDDKPKKLFGTMKLGPNTLLVVLESTTDTEIDRKKGIVADPVGTSLAKLARAKADEKEKGLKAILKENPDAPLTYLAARQLLTLKATQKDVSEADLKAVLDELNKIGGLYGPDLELNTALIAAGALAKNAKAAVLAETEVKKLDKILAKDEKPNPNLLLQVLGLKTEIKGFTEDELKTLAEKYLKLANPTDAAVELQANGALARTLTKSAKGATLAIKYAKRAEELIGKDDPPTRRVNVLKLLARALTLAGKTDEAKTVDEKVAKLDSQLDEEFVKNNMEFKPEKFGGRKGKSQRAVVCELFTGAQCPPCVSADIAFDAALKTYKYNEVIFLQYHLHIPGPDALTNHESEERQAYYGDAIGGTPTTFLDGKVTVEGLGGGKAAAEARYKSLCGWLNEEVEKDAGARLLLKVTRDGDKIEASADISDLKKTGDKVRLRFALIEDVVRYPGNNGQRLHHHIVRGFLGGTEGLSLKEAKETKTASINLATLRKSLTTYLEEANEARPFFNDDRPLSLKDLKVVAFIQDDATKEILQAAQAGVPDGK
jgi:hypothetical protein